MRRDHNFVPNPAGVRRAHMALYSVSVIISVTVLCFGIIASITAVLSESSNNMIPLCVEAGWGMVSFVYFVTYLSVRKRAPGAFMVSIIMDVVFLSLLSIFGLGTMISVSQEGAKGRWALFVARGYSGGLPNFGMVALGMGWFHFAMITTLLLMEIIYTYKWHGKSEAVWSAPFAIRSESSPRALLDDEETRPGMHGSTAALNPALQPFPSHVGVMPPPMAHVPVSPVVMPENLPPYRKVDPEPENAVLAGHPSSPSAGPSSSPTTGRLAPTVSSNATSPVSPVSPKAALAAHNAASASGSQPAPERPSEDTPDEFKLALLNFSENGFDGHNARQ